MAQSIESIALSSTTPSVGDTITYTVTPAEAVVSCLWYRDSVNSSNVIGNTASYTVQKADMGHSIICVVTGNHDSTTNPDNPWYGTEQAATEVIEAKIDTEKTIHFRGGPGITIIADGNCEHGTDTKVAKINWDGVKVIVASNSESDVKENAWFRRLKAGSKIKLIVGKDICTVNVDAPTGDAVTSVGSVTALTNISFTHNALNSSSSTILTALTSVVVDSSGNLVFTTHHLDMEKTSESLTPHVSTGKFLK